MPIFLKPTYLFSLLLVVLMLAPMVASAKAASAKKVHTVNFSASELKMLKGHYSTIAGYVYINVKGAQVTTRIKNKPIRLVKKSNGRIYPVYKFLGIFPIHFGKVSFSIRHTQGKQQIVMRSKQKKYQIVGEKFKPLTIPAEWKSRLGQYRAKLLAGKSKIKKVRLATQNGVLVAFINKLTSPYPLLASSATRLISPSAGHNKDQPIQISTAKNLIHLQYGSNKLELKKL